MGRLKIALISPGSFIIPSERSSSVEQVMKALADQIGLYTDCTIYGIREGGLRTVEHQGPVRYLRPSGRKGYVAGVIRSLGREGYDLISVDNRPRTARRVKQAFPGARVWLTLHSLTFVSGKHIGRKELARCFSCVEHIIVNSRFLQEEITRLVPEAGAKIRVIYPGVDTERFFSRWSGEGERLRTEQLQQLGYPNKKIILYVGRLVEYKGVHHLLHAMQQIAQAMPDTVLVVVGGAFYGSKRTTAYVRRLHQLGRRLPRHVLFVPYVPHKDVPQWFRLADVAVVPSPRREAFGLVNVEAMATGVPVIAAEAGGMKEIVVQNETGLLIPVDALTAGIVGGVSRLLADPSVQRRMGEAAGVRVREQFTWEQAARTWLELAQPLSTMPLPMF
ncbi:MAG: glycosyl transferase family 1 [Paenibacillaceae bacterium]|jgi:spore coat protein SA|nr:glycosyl transferase family 1 [Paenibacillaceae bacterium]